MLVGIPLPLPLILIASTPLVGWQADRPSGARQSEDKKVQYRQEKQGGMCCLNKNEVIKHGATYQLRKKGSSRQLLFYQGIVYSSFRVVQNERAVNVEGERAEEEKKNKRIWGGGGKLVRFCTEWRDPRVQVHTQAERHIEKKDHTTAFITPAQYPYMCSFSPSASQMPSLDRSLEVQVQRVEASGRVSKQGTTFKVVSQSGRGLPITIRYNSCVACTS